MTAHLPRHVLLIDDDDLSRAVLELHLAEAGLLVTEAESGDAALVLLRGPAPPGIDVVLSDLQMPGLSGSALARELRAALPADVRLLAMSGSQPPPDRWQGFDTFLLKPFTPDQFLTALKQKGAASGSIEAGQTAAAAETYLPVAVMEEKMLTQLRAMLTPRQLADLFQMSFAELTKHLGRMEVAFQSDDRASLRESAHAIKGSFAMLGAEELRGLAAGLEAATGSSADQAASLKEIPAAADRLKRMLTSRGVQLSRDSASGQETL